mmetsp:Transcript_26191/g.26436  ORF Transcript_26191/g.26436 Transcript_26191/m.26436 type:complete len:324 (-) Transcript_26191:12-983(-)
MIGSDYTPNHLRLLIVNDVDIISANRLAEYFVPKPPQFDCCIVCGPFIHSDIVSREDEAVAEGDMASTIAQLENIVCRVVYLPSDKDPVTSLADQLHLTPNSVCIHARMMLLSDGLFIAGYAEKSETLQTSTPDTVTDYTADEGENTHSAYEFQSSNSMNIVCDVLQSILDIAEMNATVSQDALLPPPPPPLSPSPLSTSADLNKSTTSSSTLHTICTTSCLPMTIFLLNYKYAHTLNQFLFHHTSLLQRAGVGLCIAPSAMDMEKPPELPNAIGNIMFAVPKSLRLGYYTTVVMHLIQHEDGVQRWSVLNIDTHQLPHSNGL